MSTETQALRVKATAGVPAVRAVFVTGVLVVHDGSGWLKECLDSLARQARPLDRLVIVDTGSIDGSQQIVAAHGRIRQACRDLTVMSMPRGSTFGKAVGGAVERLPVGPAPSQLSTEWLWLLHDDSAATPQTLDRLLEAARRSPSVGIAGPKLTTWDDPGRLLEVGPAITRSGRRAGGPAAGEPDQGQHDHRSDVLAVSTSGMLIRRDVFDTLGGFDPAFGQFRDDLDLCWRAHLAGHRVVVAPKARVREAAASTTGKRGAGLSAQAARRRDRSHGRQVALARCSLYAVPFLALWIALSSLGSAAALLALKQPRQAWAELGDLGSLLTPWHPMAARWRSRGIRRVRRRDLRGLFVPPRVGLRQNLERFRDAVGIGSSRSGVDRAWLAEDGADSVQSLETGPVSDEAEPLEAPAGGVGSRILRHPGFLAVLVGILLAGATWRSLLGGLVPGNGLGFTGGELLPVTSNASGLWHSWLDGWHGAGLGDAVESAPYLPVLSAGAWVLEHLPLIDTSTSSVGAMIAWLLVAAIPLSAWTAYLGARVVTRSPWPRAWAALAWASLATLTTAAAGGRLGAVVAHTLLPLVAAGFACAARSSTSFRTTFGAAAALAVTGAFNPALAALGAVAALVLLVLGHGRTRLRAVVLMLVPIGLLGPWVLRLVDHPLLVLSGPGLTVWQPGQAAPWQLALLHPGGPGSYAALLSAPLVLAGVVAMARREVDSPVMTVLAALTVVGLALGLASPHLVIGQTPPGLTGTGAPITAWAGTGLDLAALALIAAALRGLAGLRSEPVHRTVRAPGMRLGWRTILAAPVVTSAILGVAASVALVGWSGFGKTLSGAVPTIPAVAADQAGGQLGSRLLVLSPGVVAPRVVTPEVVTQGAVTQGGTTQGGATLSTVTRDAEAIDYRLVGREPGPVARDLPAGQAVDAAGTAEVVPEPLLAAAVRTTVTKTDATSGDAVSGEATSDSPARDALADLGVGFVAFRGSSTEPLVNRLDATAGLTRLSDNHGLILWRVLPRRSSVSPARLRVVDAEGTALESIPVTGDHGRTTVDIGSATPDGPADGRRLVVAEPAGWAAHARVTFAGRELAAVAGGKQPTYLVPAEAGRLSISLQPAEPWWRRGQLALLIAVLFLAAPFSSTRSRRPS